jgi:hypothetical protein
MIAMVSALSFQLLSSRLGPYALRLNLQPLNLEPFNLS